MTTQSRQVWIVVALIILLVVVSWTVVAIVDGVTHQSSQSPSLTPAIERTRTP